MIEQNLQVRVYWEDTDAGGIVYHASYLRFMERARTEWLRRLGLQQEVLRTEHGVLFTVTSMQLDYLWPARLDDLLEVSARLTQLGGASMTLQQAVTESAHGRDCLRAAVRIACLDERKWRPARLPAFLRERLNAC